jgi:uncharacterized protein YeaO (DUF488 family)
VILKEEDFVARAEGREEVTRVKEVFGRLVPPWKLVEGFRAGQWTWDDFEAVYKDRLKDMDLRKDLEFLGGLLGGVSELTLCCRGGRDDEHTHRKLLYDALPEDMRGVRD